MGRSGAVRLCVTLSLLPASGTSSSAPAGEWVIPPVFTPKSPRRVAAEASAVNHMLSTAAYWLASVDIASVPPAVQEELFKLAGTCLSATLFFASRFITRSTVAGHRLKVQAYVATL